MVIVNFRPEVVSKVEALEAVAKARMGGAEGYGIQGIKIRPTQFWRGIIAILSRPVPWLFESYE